MFNGSAYSVLRLDESEWFPILKFRWTEYAKWVCVGRYNPTTYHYYCNQQTDKQYIDNIQDIRGFTKDLRDIVGLILTSVAGESDDIRAEWVLEHRPDWNN